VTILGIVGGIAPGSTIEYYRMLVAAYRAARPDGSYPAIIINSIAMTRMLGLAGGDRLPELTEYLLDEIARLARAGPGVGLLASNTPHIVFDRLAARSPIPPLYHGGAVLSRCLRSPGHRGPRPAAGGPRVHSYRVHGRAGRGASSEPRCATDSSRSSAG
jgi:hypothetical protein